MYCLICIFLTRWLPMNKDIMTKALWYLFLTVVVCQFVLFFLIRQMEKKQEIYHCQLIELEVMANEMIADRERTARMEMLLKEIIDGRENVYN